jgi:transmembrane sensor
MNSKTNVNSVNHEAVEAAAAAWLARQDDASAWTASDALALDAWLRENTAHRVAWLRLRQAWARADGMKGLNRGLDRESSAADRVIKSWPQRRIAPRWMTGVALAGLMALGIGVVWRAQQAGVGEERFATTVGTRQELTLGDGSRVMLNTRTRARSVVNGNERKFWLEEGEAFFEVQSDPAHPFVITAGRDRITVLGTKFSVRHENGRTQVTVVEGRVRLDIAGAAGKEVAATSTTLTRNDSAVSEVGGVLVATKTPQQTQKELSWREGRLEFDNKSLTEIAAEFNRYNQRQLVVSPEASGLKLTGSFDTGNIDGFTRLIHTGFGVVVRTDGDQIQLSMN